jgi:outer membrane immunogenic protein
MRRLALAVLATAGFSQVALAADLPVKAAAPMTAMVAATNWTGFYVGINGGAGWGRSNQTDTAGTTSGDYNQSGGLVGGTLGYNWQVNNLVIGVEGDYDWANINGSVSPAVCSVACFTNLRSLGTVRARLGMTWGNWMPYLTGGIAWGRVNTGQTGLPAFGANTTKSGGTFGGGVEVMLAPKWSGKVEYLYTNLGTTTYIVAIPVNVTEKVHVVRVGVNYHF